MPANTTKNWLLEKAPKHTQLFGDKTKKVESSTHIIEFPGGAVEVSRTSDGNYWAHIMLNRGQALEDVDGRENAIGEITGSRIDYSGSVVDIPQAQDVHQIAILIKPVRPYAKGAAK